MRALLVAAALLLAGCVAPGLTTNSTPNLVLPEIPEGAKVESIEGGLRLVFDAASFPFKQNVTVPEGATIVRATALAGASDAISVTMRNAETLRRRCNFAPVDAWSAPVLGQGACSGVTLVDHLPATWEVIAASAALKGSVQVDILTMPVDGILAELDASQLSMRDFEAGETTVEKVPSFDGTELHLEVTLPQGDGPWPTIISSSPYNHDDRLASGKPAMWAYFTQDWVERGYAVVNADVRGYGFSEGCVEVWSENEQKDQAFLVDWVAEQPWSDRNVGFYGQSYVGTTPVEAAVNAPDALKAIIAVAPVVDSYNDWHFGGVPNGENSLSPVGYQTIGSGLPLLGVPDVTDQAAMTYTLGRADNGFCDPSITLVPNDPRSVYDAFYVERNFSARAGDVKAAVMYTEGFEDTNVKSAEIPDWFNAITAPKLGLFGHWIHQHPTRADNEALMLLWLDQFVKGKPVGFAPAQARVLANDGTERVADAWPPLDAPTRTLHLDPAGGALVDEPAQGSAQITTDSLAGTLPLFDALPLPTSLTMTSAPLAEPLRFGGQGVVRVATTVQHAENAYVAAYLYEDTADGSTLVTWGMYNLAHRFGHESYEPVQPGERVQVGIPLLPTEWAFSPDSTLRLELRGAAVGDAIGPAEIATLEIFADGSAIELPLVDGAVPMPATAQR